MTYVTQLSNKDVKKGERVLIKPEYQDDGDELLIFVAIDDMEKGRVSIMPINTGLQFPPISTVNRHMLSL